ncbi:MAG: DNA-methyltransferase [Pseudohongiellaceae bacterium]
MADKFIKFLTGDAAVVLAGISAASIDAVITSPPYDTLRNYNGYSFDFPAIAGQLARVLKPGGVIMWNVGDEVIDGTESGNSFRQALHFKDECGLRLHDTMIYEKIGSAYPAGEHNNRYTQIFEYCFILSKGRPKTANLIRDKINNWGGTTTFAKPTYWDKDGKLLQASKKRSIAEVGMRTNIWRVWNGKVFGNQWQNESHPAVMPLSLAADHIRTWTNADDIVLDPFCGSGTSGVAARQLGRQFIGIDISAEYIALSEKRIVAEVGTLLDKVE